MNISRISYLKELVQKNVSRERTDSDYPFPATLTPPISAGRVDPVEPPPAPLVSAHMNRSTSAW